MAAEIRVIAREPGCTAVRISRGEPERISVAAQAAAGKGSRCGSRPSRAEVPAASLVHLFSDCADRAEHLRRDGAKVVLVIGCELTLLNPGYPAGYALLRSDPAAGPAGPTGSRRVASLGLRGGRD